MTIEDEEVKSSMVAGVFNAMYPRAISSNFFSNVRTPLVVGRF